VNVSPLRRPDYHAGAVMVMLGAALGAGIFTWQGWNPFVGLALGWVATFVVMAALLAVVDGAEGP
jgi:CHASE2 domain-containing sensor protein